MRSGFNLVNRRQLLRGGLAGALTAACHPIVLAQSAPASAQPQSSPPPRPDPLAPAMVQEFVRKAHTDLAATQALLQEQPGLLNATWDWGGGDFEMGIGGAGHMGNRDIAVFLISKGGRLDVFVAAMLGRIELVKAYLAAFPGLVESKGPHGISLMRHAVAGGTDAKPVVDYLKSVGAH